VWRLNRLQKRQALAAGAAPNTLFNR
jgi:hypothetical protein